MSRIYKVISFSSLSVRPFCFFVNLISVIHFIYLRLFKDTETNREKKQTAVSHPCIFNGNDFYFLFEWCLNRTLNIQNTAETQTHLQTQTYGRPGFLCYFICATCNTGFLPSATNLNCAQSLEMFALLSCSHLCLSCCLCVFFMLFLPSLSLVCSVWL